MKRIKVAIIGTGNIGSDLLMKIKKSEFLECTLFAGRNPDSPGMRLAREHGIPYSCNSIQAIEENPDCCEIVFDATSAQTHLYNAPILKSLGKFVLDLTPARVGKMCVPVINFKECISEENVNLITCGGQASVPIAHAISQVHPETSYIEIAATIASRSAGIGTRNNIDEFTQATKEALAHFSGVKNTKAIIILNPAEPPITMRNTIYAVIDKPDMEQIKIKVREIEKQIQQYVPGYHVVLEPVYENGRITTSVEVLGSGDYLPEYAGNLDIITCASIKIAEEYARRKLEVV
ncbi:MAG TPA: acetaldehyde dehydrogenase (acetylating) [Spirochaetota bacterium]|nr:acetaldehyde dehydrogenase (acetylating) [Spirochaetota bacterium]